MFTIPRRDVSERLTAGTRDDVAFIRVGADLKESVDCLLVVCMGEVNRRVVAFINPRRMIQQ
jgi:hypothetical protein